MNEMNRMVEVFHAPEKPDEHSVVAVLGSHVEAEQAVRILHQSGLDLNKCSIVGREDPTGEHVVAYYLAGDRLAAWGKMGAFWGAIWGLLGGSALFLVPGIGTVLVGGTLVTAMFGALEGAVVGGGLSVLGAGLSNLGVAPKSIAGYETALKEDRYIVIVHGNATEASAAKVLLEGISEKRRLNSG